MLGHDSMPCYSGLMGTMSTRGQMALELLTAPKPHTQASVARELRVTREAVRRWTAGMNRPEPRLRAELERHTGIPAAWWDEPTSADPGEVGRDRVTRFDVRWREPFLDSLDELQGSVRQEGVRVVRIPDDDEEVKVPS